MIIGNCLRRVNRTFEKIKRWAGSPFWSAAIHRRFRPGSAASTRRGGWCARRIERFTQAAEESGDESPHSKISLVRGLLRRLDPLAGDADQLGQERSLARIVHVGTQHHVGLDLDQAAHRPSRIVDDRALVPVQAVVAADVDRVVREAMGADDRARVRPHHRLGVAGEGRPGGRVPGRPAVVRPALPHVWL